MKKKELKFIVETMNEDISDLANKINNICNEIDKLNEQNKKISIEELLTSKANTKVKTFTISHADYFEFGESLILNIINKHFPGVKNLTVKEIK